jgi:hypothetical protein
MWISELCERAIKSALQDAEVTHAIRLSRVNDTGKAPEDRIYPCITVVCESGRQKANQSFFYLVPTTITLATIYRDDTKRETLAQMEDGVRTVIDNGIKDAFDTIRDEDGSSWYYKGILDLTGGSPDIDNKEQSIEITFEFAICGQG